jgi:hypothetical protein
METKLLLLSGAAGSFGFLIWYALSASLRLPKSFQIQYDINSPYLNRILRRRLLMFILYALIPYLLIRSQNFIGKLSLGDLGIHFIWNQTSTLWIVGLFPLIIINGIISSKKESNLVEYPEIRLTLWSRKIFILSALTWVLQIVGIEFLFRGLLLQSLRMWGSGDLSAVLISAGLYGLTHYFKRNRISVFSIPYGVLAGYVVITTDSLLPVIILHLSNALVTEWFSIKYHPEIKTI